MTRILLIEDDLDIADFIQRGLVYKDYDVEVAHDGEAGLEAASDKPPDLVLLDIGLPGLSGLEVCRRLRDEAGTADTPVLFLTGLGREAEEEAAATVGAQGVITKPFSPSALVKQVAQMLRRPAAAAAGR